VALSPKRQRGRRRARACAGRGHISTIPNQCCRPLRIADAGRPHTDAVPIGSHLGHLDGSKNLVDRQLF